MALGCKVFAVVFVIISSVASAGHGKKRQKLVRRSGRNEMSTNKSTASVNPLDGFIEKWAADNGIEAYSVLAGDKTGIRYMKVQQSTNTASFNQAHKVQHPMEVFSVGKWVAAASIGFAMKNQAEPPGGWKKFGWDDPISRFIPWWTRNPRDGRSKITFRHLLGHTSGLVADSAVMHGLGWQDMFKHADCGWRNTSFVLRQTAAKAYHQTSPSINPPEDFRYGETHYLVAQYAAMMAFFQRGRTWRRFLWFNWGRVLGLQVRVIRPSNEWMDGRYFENDAGGRGYGFFEFDRKPHKNFVTNPDQGSQMIAAPCAMARFLTQMARQGNDLFMSDTLDEPRTSTSYFEPMFGKYTLGHWVYDDVNPPVYHSLGAFGAVPIMSTLPDGTKFWIYLGAYEPENGLGKGSAFIKGAADAARTLFSSTKASYTLAGCSAVNREGDGTYIAQFGPLSGGVREPRHLASFVEQERYSAKAQELEEEMDEMTNPIQFLEEHEFGKTFADGSNEEEEEEIEDGEARRHQIRAHAKRTEVVVNAHGDEEPLLDMDEEDTGRQVRDVIVDANGDARNMD